VGTGARAARAQQAAGFAVDRFEPAAAGSSFLSVDSLDFDGHLRLAGGLTSAWAWKPLVVYDGQSNEVSALVRQELVEHVQGAVVLWNRARFDLDLPVPLAASGTSTAVGEQVYGAPGGTGVGDLRLGGSVRLFRVRDRITGALGAQLFLPTGTRKAFSSDGGVRFWPQLLAAGRYDRLAWGARLGVHIRPQNDCACDLSPGTELTMGGAGTWRFNRWIAAGPEVYVATAVAGGPFASRAGTSLEVMLAGHVAVAPRWNVSFGVAPGLTDGAGTPAARVVAGVQYVIESVKPSTLSAEPPAWTSPGDGPPSIEPPPAGDSPGIEQPATAEPPVTSTQVAQ
jgi:OOP family OmpA-OmpF porin